MSRRAPTRIGRALVGVAVAISFALIWSSFADAERGSNPVTRTGAMPAAPAATTTTQATAPVEVVERPTTTTAKPKPAPKKVAKKAKKKHAMTAAQPTLAKLREQ